MLKSQIFDFERDAMASTTTQIKTEGYTKTKLCGMFDLVFWIWIIFGGVCVHSKENIFFVCYFI